MATRAPILSHLATLLTPDDLGNIELKQSPPQFDNTAKLATTEFVQQSLGSFSDLIGLDSDTTITIDQAGTYFELGIPGGFTVTLPDPGDRVSIVYSFTSTADAPVTLVTPAGNIVTAGVYESTYAVMSRSSLQIVSDGANWVAFNGVAPTQPLADKTKNIANTEFVQRALGNRSGYVTYAVDATLTEDDYGKYVYCKGSGALITITLPDPTTAPLGASLYIQAASTNDLTLLTPGFIFSGPNGSSSDTMLLPNGSASEFICGGTGWIAVGGSGGHWVGNAGFQKMASGIIFQWGFGSNIAGDIAVTFPMAFPHAAFLVVACSGYTAGSNQTGNVAVGGWTTTGFIGCLSNPGLGWQWFAIGY